MGHESGESEAVVTLVTQVDCLRELVRQQLEAYYLKRRETLLIELGWIEELLGIPRTKPPRRKGA